MKKECFKEITQEHIKVCENIIEMKGDCGVPMCDKCPFNQSNTSILIPVEEEDKDEFNCEFYPELSMCSIITLNYIGITTARYEKCLVSLAKQFIEMVKKLGVVKED